MSKTVRKALLAASFRPKASVVQVIYYIFPETAAERCYLGDTHVQQMPVPTI